MRSNQVGSLQATAARLRLILELAKWVSSPVFEMSGRKISPQSKLARWFTLRALATLRPDPEILRTRQVFSYYLTGTFAARCHMNGKPHPLGQRFGKGPGYRARAEMVAILSGYFEIDPRSQKQWIRGGRDRSVMLAPTFEVDDLKLDNPSRLAGIALRLSLKPGELRRLARRIDRLDGLILKLQGKPASTEKSEERIKKILRSRSAARGTRGTLGNRGTKNSKNSKNSKTGKLGGYSTAFGLVPLGNPSNPRTSARAFGVTPKRPKPQTSKASRGHATRAAAPRPAASQPPRGGLRPRGAGGNPAVSAQPVRKGQGFVVYHSPPPTRAEIKAAQLRKAAPKPPRRSPFPELPKALPDTLSPDEIWAFVVSKMFDPRKLPVPRSRGGTVQLGADLAEFDLKLCDLFKAAEDLAPSWSLTNAGNWLSLWERWRTKAHEFRQTLASEFFAACHRASVEAEFEKTWQLDPTDPRWEGEPHPDRPRKPRRSYGKFPIPELSAEFI